jgi:hypothetical protein
MLELWEKFRPDIPPIYKINEQTFERKVHYPETTWIYEKVKMLEEHGWTLEGFTYESEKRAAEFAIKQLNEKFEGLIPQDIIDHARKYFPNLTIILPKIDLGE